MLGWTLLAFSYGALLLVAHQVTRMGAPNMMQVMERAIEAGHSVLVENMGETIDAVLNPIITRSTFKKGRSLYVKLGDKECEYNKNFRLFLHTKLSNPHYPPEIQVRCMPAEHPFTHRRKPSPLQLSRLQRWVAARLLLLRGYGLISHRPTYRPLLHPSLPHA